MPIKLADGIFLLFAFVSYGFRIAESKKQENRNLFATGKTNGGIDGYRKVHHQPLPRRHSAIQSDAESRSVDSSQIFG